MKLNRAVTIWSVLLLMAGCASVAQRGAMVADGVIENPSLGFFGFSFQIPEGYDLYSPAAKNPADCNDLQRMAIRIYDLNKAYHPRDNELFYESFLLLSDKTCFLLITVKSGTTVSLDDSPFSAQTVARWPLMPLYNTMENRAFELGETRQPAVCARGTAYEQKGWYYADPKRNRIPFSYEACKVEGGNRDSYVLMGFALPDDAKALAAPMKQMICGMKFSSR